MAGARLHHLQPVFRHDQVGGRGADRSAHARAGGGLRRRREIGNYINGEWKSVEREQIKKAVKERTIRLIVATDAACEGLNLQTLGTLINVDLPWNPSRLEQRIGRIKRFGQRRDRVSDRAGRVPYPRPFYPRVTADDFPKPFAEARDRRAITRPNNAQGLV